MSKEESFLFPPEEIEKLQDSVRKHYEKAFEAVVSARENDEPLLISVVEDEPETVFKGKLQSDLFDVQEVAEENAGIAEEKKKVAIIEARKTMNLPYFSNPKDDNELLLNYQHDFIKNNDQEAWGKLLILSSVVSKRLLWKWLSEHPKEFLDDIAQDEKVSIAVLYVLRRYKENVGWYVKKNFISALKSGVLHAMRYTTEIDKNTVYSEDLNNERKGNKKK